MADKLTPQQEMAVKNRGGKLLVSAAAGSGKTKVLVDRLLDYIMDPVDPANIDDFLIITYTKAAAAELRSKIAAKLSERMAEHPENRHLQRQMQRLYLTKISTVHAFCGDVLRQYAHLLDLPSDFRVADENECAQLREDVMSVMLDSAYENAARDDDFRSFVDAQGLGRDDRLVPQILLKVYDSARCHLDPDGWLDSCVESAAVEGLTDAGQTIWGSYLIEELFAYLDLQLAAMERCAAEAKGAEGMEKPAQLLAATVTQLLHLRESRTWDEILARKNVDYGRLVFSKKCPDQALAEQIKAVRNACKAGLDKKLKAFADDSAQVLADMAQTTPAVRGMVALVQRFGKEFDRAKSRRRIMDFGDLEHRMLDLLLGKRRDHITAAAREIGDRFREILVDEYQDSNGVQDAIFGALTEGRSNCFMVGDVKQSIYQFRLADPTIFLNKYNSFADAADAAPGEDRKVLLSANFRSGGAVLRSVNDVFRLCMSPAVGGLHYGEQEALREGIPHCPLGEEEVELWGINVQQDTYAEEAAFVARRIEELLDGGHFVRDGAGLRLIEPQDIAILLRSPGSSGHHYIQALARRGIRCTSGGGEDLLQTREIGVLRAILQTVSNPRQDIPLIAALASPVFGFTADDLAVLRAENRFGCIYDALLASKMPKAGEFLNILGILRREARMGTLAQLMEKIFLLTGLDSVFAAMPNGDARGANLKTFYALAAEFERTSRRDLEQFLEHLQALEEKGLVAAGEQSVAGCVTLMSIHKSKGLEFPVVFVCGLSKSFNREDIRAQVLCHQSLKLGLAAVDGVNRLRYPTIAKGAIGAKMTADSLSEELRVLYVALTRARDRLIMTYASQNLQKDLTEIVGRMDLSDPELLTRDVVCAGEWVLMTALKRTEAGELFRLAGRPRETQLGDPVWKIGVVTETLDAGDSTLEEDTPVLSEETLERLKEALAFRYSYEAATQAPSKQTATQRKGREKDAEAAENAPEEKLPVRSWRKPAFAEQRADGAARGIALHTAMQYIDYGACGSQEAVGLEIRRLVREGYLRPEQAELVDAGAIAAFFATELGRKLQSGENVLREFKFSILDDGKNYDPALEGEKILLQGVVDCALMEPEGITILDFKTDHVTEQTLQTKVEHYRPQVQAYAEALKRIYGMPVQTAVLYFFRLGKFVEV